MQGELCLHDGRAAPRRAAVAWLERREHELCATLGLRARGSELEAFEGIGAQFFGVENQRREVRAQAPASSVEAPEIELQRALERWQLRACGAPLQP
jgi:hypothetical protein